MVILTFKQSLNSKIDEKQSQSSNKSITSHRQKLSCIKDDNLKPNTLRSSTLFAYRVELIT